MSYDQGLAERIRRALARRPGITEKEMFGGIAFLLQGNMLCGVIGQDLMARVGPEAHEEALSRPHARPMDFAGRPMKGYVYVGLDGLRADDALSEWIACCLEFVAGMPPKAKKAKAAKPVKAAKKAMPARKGVKKATKNAVKKRRGR